MSDEIDPQLGLTERRLLARHQAGQRMPSDLHDDIWNRLQETIAVDDGVAGEETPRRDTRGRLAVALAVAAVVLGALMLSRLTVWAPAEEAPAAPTQAPAQRVEDDRPRSVRADPPAARRRVNERTSNALRGEQPAGPAPPAPESTMADPRGDEVPAVERRRPQRAPEAKPQPSLSEELELLRQAQTALSRGYHPRVLELVRRHREKYPDSALAPEREALGVLSRCARTEVPEEDARAAARSYLSVYRGSPHTVRLEEACLR